MVDWYSREVQLTVAGALLDMLTAADKADLPPMRWTVNVSGYSLYGETDGPCDDSPQKTFDAWVKHLGLRAGKPYVNTMLDRREQRAAGSYKHSGRTVPVGILMISDQVTKVEG